MKAVLVLLVFSIFAAPRESFAEPAAGGDGALKLILNAATNGLGVTKFDKSDIQREKNNAISNIDKCTIDVFKWIDDQCVRQKCEWTIPKTHIDGCRSAVRDMKNCIKTETKNLRTELEVIIKRFESACRAYEKTIPKPSAKNQACRKIMGQILAMLLKMLNDCKTVADHCHRDVYALLSKHKSIL